MPKEAIDEIWFRTGVIYKKAGVRSGKKLFSILIALLNSNIISNIILQCGDGLLFISDYKKVISTVIHPRVETKRKMSIKEGILYYIKGTAIPYFLLAISILLFIHTSNLNVNINFTPPFSYFAQYLFPYGIIGQVTALIIALLLAIYLFAVVGIAILAAIIYTMGKILVTPFKGNYAKTFSGIVYGVTAAISAIWLPFLGLVIGVSLHFEAISLLFILIAILVVLWGYIVEIIAVATQNEMPEYISVLFTIIIVILIIMLSQSNLLVSL
jgi:hypothetical protein